MNENILSQVPQCDQDAQYYKVPIIGGGNDVSVVPPEMTNGEITKALRTLVNALTTHANMGFPHRVNVVESTMISTLRDFVRMNAPIFLTCTVGEDLNEFIHGV